MTSYERTGWRDQWISDRHRQWSVNLPCVDMDCLMLAEYNFCQPCALIEYKHCEAKFNLQDANNRALKNLADRAGLPFFIVRYNDQNLKFGVIPVNEQALTRLPTMTVYYEGEYVNFLHRLRGRTK